MIDHRQTITIVTPEGTPFTLTLAGPVVRSLSLLIDLLIILCCSMSVGIFMGYVRFISSDGAIALTIFLQFAISTGYGIVMEWTQNGQTIGKRVMKIQVVDEKGMQLSLSQVIIRNLLRTIDMLPFFYLIGGLSCMLSKKNMRLGDIAANTVVITLAKPQMPDFDQIATEKYNSLRNSPHLAARLRSSISMADCQLALQALLRRNEFEPSARVAVFREIKQHILHIVAVPTELVDTVSDEQFVKNIVEILFQSHVRS
ncbi:MAG: RDD family protein [Chitinivibrionales bacterium]|nr:RDD family protein [Chitinivibrionales bacterium]